MVKKLAVGTVLIITLSGCSGIQRLGSDKLLIEYIDDYVEAATVIHYSGDMAIHQWEIDKEEINKLRDWLVGLEYDVYKFAERPYSELGKDSSIYNIRFNDMSFSYLMTEVGNYLEVGGYWFSILNTSPIPIKIPKLTLEEIKELVKKGNKLTWADFERYEHKDIGSGVHIYVYDVDEEYKLVISGRSLNEIPSYIELVASGGRSIDIREGGIEEFMKGD